MSLTIYSHYSLDFLGDLYCRKIYRANHSSFPRRETAAVQSKGMEAWLKQKIASCTPIAASLSFPFINSVVNETLSLAFPEPPRQPDESVYTLFPSSSGFRKDRNFLSRETLTWKIFGILLKNGLEQYPSFHRYACNSGGKRELKIFQLSEKLASVFDLYQIYCPELLLAWTGLDTGNSSSPVMDAGLP